MSPRWFRRCLLLCAPLIAVLWVAGVAHFHGLALAQRDWLVVIAAAFALHVVWRRLVPQRPLPPLPKDTNRVRLAALAALFVALPVGLLGALFEVFADAQQPSGSSLWLRCVWHATCAYAFCYCGFLLRLTGQYPEPPRS